MTKEIIINSAINDTRIAITEDGELAEFLIELPSKERYIGNIYLGRVNKVAPGLNAAFIDIGLNQDAFLHFSDVDDVDHGFLTEEEDSEDLDLTKQIKDNANNNSNNKKNNNNTKSNEVNDTPNLEPANIANDNHHIYKTKKSGNIKINLQEGKFILVQVMREAYAKKGMKVTSKIAIPGRYVVLLPYEKMLGVSKKISKYPERKRLRSLAKSFLPDGAGCIIRTASLDKSEDELKKDWTNVIDTWNEIETKFKKAKNPTLVYQDMQLATSVIRDLFTSNVKKVITDSKRMHREILNYIQSVSPVLEDKIELYTGTKSIFDEYGIEKELAKTNKKRINLPTGGDIVVDYTEAMTIIDVNSGKTSEKEQEKISLRTNLEAAKEIARQIRLRDLGGMILVDFIDMYDDQSKKKLFYEMKKFMSRDRAKSVIYPLTQLSIMQITRQRINQNISEKVSEICPNCRGTGRITSKEVIVNDIERWLRNFKKKSNEFRLILTIHPLIADYITEGTLTILSKLMIKYFVRIKLQQNDTFPVDQFKFHSIRQQKDITFEYQ